jgi:hypothetical protein
MNRFFNRFYASVGVQKRFSDRFYASADRQRYSTRYVVSSHSVRNVSLGRNRGNAPAYLASCRDASLQDAHVERKHHLLPSDASLRDAESPFLSLAHQHIASLYPFPGSPRRNAVPGILGSPLKRTKQSSTLYHFICICMNTPPVYRRRCS